MALALVCLVALLYGRLLLGPISLNFLSDRVQTAVAGVVDDTFVVAWEDFGLSLTGPASLGFRLSGVKLTERASAAEIRMEALEIGLSPIGAAMGRPDARVALIGPHFQMVQDLLGPRLSRFEMVEDEASGEALIQILEGDTIAPAVRIGSEGLSLGTEQSEALGLRSDNDWLIYNFEAMNSSLADIARQAMDGQISRLSIRNGSVGVLDTVYGLYKEFDNVSLELRAGRDDGRVSAIFEAEIAGRTMHGTLARREFGLETRIEADISYIDFSTIIPFLDDAEGLAAIRGAGALAMEIGFDADGGKVQGGRFIINLSGTSLRLANDFFAISTAPFAVDWTPGEARFHFPEIDLQVGQTRGLVSGDMVLGFDRQFGPTVGMSIRATDVWLHPDDLDAPAEPFEVFSLEGWSAPLYGALGIDRMVGAKDGVSVVMQGRIDAVRDGVGVDVTLSGRGASADDLKRLWPSIFAPDVREWFTQYVIDGSVHSADMRFNFPVGTISTNGEKRRIPDGAMSIDLVGSEVELQPFEGLPQFEVAGESRVTVRDNQFTMAFERATITDPSGNVNIANAAFLNQDTSADAQVFEISGDISGTVPTLVRIANREPLNLLKDFQFGFDLDTLAGDVGGDVETTVIATIAVDDTGRMVGTDYALNGVVSGLHSRNPIEGLNVADANLSFTASQEGFRVVGAGKVQDVALDLQATKGRETDPEILVATTVSVADAQRFGVDLSEFMSGQVRLVAKPMQDGSFQIAADLAEAALTLRDIGVSKARGVAGTLNAVIRAEGDHVHVPEVDLAFGDVRLRGGLSVTTAGALESASFSTFQISPGDNTRVSMAPIEGGFSLSVEGEQLDIKPVLKRFFNLEGDSSAGASNDLQNQTFNVRVKLDRALGYFGTAAYNLVLDLSVRGDELRRVNMTAQLGGDRTVSATTNPLATGRVISYASNDVGAILRFVGVYPRLVGGEGSLVMRYDVPSRTDHGELLLRNFAIVDEGNVAQIVGGHSDSRQMISRSNALSFEFGRAQFTRTAERIEVLEAALHGDSVGGTIRGNILTRAGQYDLAGTYVPLFGLNNVFQQLPILGPIFGGRDGEGLLGVTFAIRGPLAQPDILVNPVSILAPGVFRSLFEYRAQAGR